MIEIPHQYLREVKSKQFLLMIDDSKSTSVTTITICNHCKTNQAEIFQDNGGLLYTLLAGDNLS